MVPRKVGAAWEVLTPAKLNLYLEVLGKRTDGFHELETLMVPVGIYDELRWTPEPPTRASEGPSLSILDQVSPDSSCPRGEDNLVLKAARLLAARAGIQPWGHFQLIKRIHPQAGVGGGSSDAAATLVVANKGWQLGFSCAELAELAAELGSDVPFFLHSGPAVCRGRGELVQPLENVPRLNFVVVKPNFGLSTPEVFRKLALSGPIPASRRQDSAGRIEKLIKELSSGDLGRASRRMANRLEEAAALLNTEIQSIKAALARAGCWAQLMTGSGSGVVGIARSFIHARRIARMLSAQSFGTVLAAASAW